MSVEVHLDGDFEGFIELFWIRERWRQVFKKHLNRFFSNFRVALRFRKIEKRVDLIQLCYRNAVAYLRGEGDRPSSIKSSHIRHCRNVTHVMIVRRHSSTRRSVHRRPSSLRSTPRSDNHSYFSHIRKPRRDFAGAPTDSMWKFDNHQNTRFTRKFDDWRWSSYPNLT